MVILIVGLRGCGKSTLAKELIGSKGLAYDMDSIASAFRLRGPHEERFRPARNMANDFFFGFLCKVQDYTDRVVIIRTAPRIEEVERICPDKVIWMRTRYVKRPMDDEDAALKRIARLISWSEAAGIPVDVR